MDYMGINPDILFLLEENRFRNSKEFYDENKEKIKQGMTIPMRQIAAYFGEKLLDIDPMINANPVTMVSRVRRDTRFSKDKRLYRDNMWIMFMRDKHSFEEFPCMWFEVTPKNFSYGIAFFNAGSKTMAVMREQMREKPKEFIKAIKSVESVGANQFDRQYKKKFPNCPEGLEKYYNSKDIGFIKYDEDLTKIFDGRVIEQLEKDYKSFIPLYKLLLTVAQKQREDEQQ